TAVSIGRLAVETGVFPLFEVEHGHYRISPDMPRKLRPIRQYFKPQGRFRHLKEDEIDKIQERVTLEYQKLMGKAKYL
ncbi:MAG: pyruvate ferredoxin oxidoreductase, partial [Smithellaceae bacterium]|nr:pyruvate ferredoxin oxidoreductase [Smithellaceae bacterium]